VEQRDVTRLEKWLSKNAKGDKFLPRPWDNASVTENDKIPPLLKFRIRPTRLVVILGFLFFVFGFLFHSKPVTALGISFLTIVCCYYESARRKTLAWSLGQISVDSSTPEGSVFQLRLQLHNHSAEILPMVVLYIPFPGSRVQSYFHIESSLKPNETRKVSIDLKADAGMGRFPIGKIKVTVRDALALFYLCTEYEWQTWVEVVPEFNPIEKFPWALRGLSVQMGDFETKLGGESVDFLSLRDWRLGDTIRKIDWKKSLRMGDLFVKDFERVVAADATLLIDQCTRGHSEFEGVSSMEKMRDSLISLIHFLMDQQIRTQLFSNTHRVPFHISDRNTLSETVSQLKPAVKNHFVTMLEEAEPLIPPDSVAMLLFCTGNVSLEQLLPCLLRLEDRRVQTFLIAFDSKAFAGTVAADAHLSILQMSIAQWSLAEIGKGNSREPLEKLLSKISERSFLITPTQSIQDQCSERSPY
jgi:uncharacterized protein (DUF58 family)